MNRKIRVLFMQSQTFFGSDSMIHSLFMRDLDRSRVDVYVACNAGSRDRPSASLKALETLPKLHLRPTYFGPTTFFVPKREVARQAVVSSVPLLVSLASLASYIKAQQIDIIHCTEKPRDAFYGFLLSRLTGTRCIIHLHVKVENWISPLVRWAMKHADGLIGVSDFVARSAVAMGCASDRVYSVLNGLDATLWDDTLDGSSVREEFGVAPDESLLVIISRIFPWKGHGDLLQALARVKQQGSRFKLLIVGDDDPRATPGNGDYSTDLNILTQQLGLTDQVIFTGFRKDVARILAASDIYAMPSFEEPCAVAFLEAMAMKKPVIALASGGTVQLVDHGKAGLLAPPQDIDQLAAHILTLINDPALRHHMGAYGRRRVEEYFTPRRMAHDLEQVYRRILGAPGSESHPQDFSTIGQLM